ncbi:MAG TPA: PepSY domain-containing protein [Chitinophagaceae bacterium]|nr:PepSY domain-containing protein [Chitinophagaceae bacterium]
MKAKYGILVIAAFALLGSCKNSGSEKETTDTTTTTYDNTNTNTGYSSIEVPANTRTSFQTKYPNATNVTWYRFDPANRPIEWEWSGWPELDTSDYAARFNWEGRDYWVWYDDDQWVGTVTNVADFSTLPTAVTGAINSAYPGYTITSAHMENDKDRNAYEITLEKGSDRVKLLIDENGKVMKKKAVTGGVETKEKPIKDSKDSTE